MNTTNILLASIGIVIIIGLLYFLLFKIPDSKSYYMPENNLDPSMKKLVKIFGPDIIGMIPDKTKEKISKDEEIDLLIRKSGNPWGLTVSEFYLLKITMGIAGLLLGIIIGFFVGIFISSLLGIIMAIILPLIMWNYPSSTYQKLANERDMEFKKRLPEAIDLLIMTLSSGQYTLINGIEKVIPHLEESPIKDEFIAIVNDTQSGISVNDALQNFADRVPTEGIKAFVKALNNANRLSVDMTQILEARAIESRKELRDEAEKRIAALPGKVMGVLSPASVIAILIIAIAPFAYMLVNAF